MRLALLQEGASTSPSVQWEYYFLPPSTEGSIPGLIWGLWASATSLGFHQPISALGPHT